MNLSLVEFALAEDWIYEKKMAGALALFISSVLFVSGSNAVYYGAKINDFANRFHNIKGEVYAVDSRTIFIKVRSE